MNILFKATILGFEKLDDGLVRVKLKTHDGKVTDAPLNAKDVTSEISLIMKSLACKDLKVSEKFTIEIKSEKDSEL